MSTNLQSAILICNFIMVAIAAISGWTIIDTCQTVNKAIDEYLADQDRKARELKDGEWWRNGTHDEDDA